MSVLRHSSSNSSFSSLYYQFFPLYWIISISFQTFKQLFFPLKISSLCSILPSGYCSISLFLVCSKTPRKSCLKSVFKFSPPNQAFVSTVPPKMRLSNFPKVSTLLNSAQFLVFILSDLPACTSPMSSRFIYPTFNISTWMSNRHVKLNISNIEFLIIFPQIHINNCFSHLVNSIFPGAQAKNLDYILDS